MRSDGIVGAIIGDIAGSTRESRTRKVADRGFAFFDDAGRFTDDTVLTIAVAQAVRTDLDFATAIHHWANRYPHAGFGGMFRRWMALDEKQPYGSFGNGSIMRVSPVAYASDDLDEVLNLAKASADVTHDHPEGVRGAQAIAAAVFTARLGGSPADVATAVTGFGYDLEHTVQQWRDETSFDVTCMGTVPAAVRAVLEATSLEEAVRNAVYIGGDADTLAAVAGSIAAELFGVPDALTEAALDRLTEPLREQVTAFDAWLDR